MTEIVSYDMIIPLRANQAVIQTHQVCQERKSVSVEQMRWQALPSPYGLCAELIDWYAFLSVNRISSSSTIFATSVPTSLTVPADTASGRSVVSRMTSTGLPSDGASSWIPPESVKMMCAWLIRYTKGK